MNTLRFCIFEISDPAIINTYVQREKSGFVCGVPCMYTTDVFSYTYIRGDEEIIRARVH